MGNLWIGYNGIGLVKFSPGTNTYQLFTTCDGLPGNYPNGIAFTPDGRIWVATDNGVGIIIPSADTIFASFSLPYVCQSRPTTIPNATLGATAFRWELDGQTIATTKNLMYTFGQPGQHILTLVARNAQGCETAVSQVIEVHPEADLSKMPTTLVPCDNSAKLEAPAGLFRYEWRLPNGAASDGPSVAADKNGLYRLTVTDHCGGTAVEQITVLLSDCVWPGDVNTDGVVDYRDWVLMSPAFGFTGPARDAQDISFYGHPAQPWSGQLPNGANLKHADTDGNGVIDMHDFKAIEVNYGKSHGAHPGLGGPEPSPLHFVPMVLHTEKDPDKKQSTVTVGILVEDESGHLNTFSSFGGVFGWTLPAPLELAGEPKVDFMVDPGYGVEGTTVVSRFWPLSGRLALTRAPLDHLDRRNIQLLAAVDIIIIEDNVGIGDTLEVLFSFSGAQALTAGGAFLPIGTLEETFTVTDTKQPLDPRLADLGLLTFPNPSEGIFTAILTGADEGKTVFSVMDALGRPVWQETRNSARATIDLSGLPAGTYFLRAVSGHRQATRPLVKL